MEKLHNLISKLHMSGASTITPPKLANEMLDKLPTDIWGDPTKTFLDPACGTGTLYLCCLERLNEGLKGWEPDDRKRLTHIMTKQLYAADIDHKQIRRLKASLKNLGLNMLGDAIYNNIRNVSSLEYDWSMKFDVVVGNPPYQAQKGFKVPESFLIVDGKYGKKQLYYFFTKLALDIVSPEGTVLYVQPTNWLRSNDATRLRNWLNTNDWKIEQYIDVSDSNYFQNVTTSAGIVIFKHGKDLNFVGKDSLWITEEWVKKWVLSSEEGNVHHAIRGGVKISGECPETVYYSTYKRGIKVDTQAAEQEKLMSFEGEKIILFPEFLAPLRNNFAKASVVAKKPFSDIFIGIDIKKSDNADDILAWIQSDVFIEVMNHLRGSSHGGSLCKYFLTEEAFNKNIKQFRQQRGTVTK